MCAWVVGIGLGCAEFPFSRAARNGAGSTCLRGPEAWIRSWQPDRIVGRQPFLESMGPKTDGALGRAHAANAVRHETVSLAFRDPVLLAKQCAPSTCSPKAALLPAFGMAVRWRSMAGDPHRPPGRAVARPTECRDIIRRSGARASVRLQAAAFYQLKGVTIAPRPVRPIGRCGRRLDRTPRRAPRAIGTAGRPAADPTADAGRVVLRSRAPPAGRADPSTEDPPWRRLRVSPSCSQDAPAVAKAMDAYAKTHRA